ncbi:hypothetical protein HDU77_006777 [Chytriomyces hyalinus]|nr:hypothetical protein HDU77_006777 [Chytriomyces hyalinus]
MSHAPQGFHTCLHVAARRDFKQIAKNGDYTNAQYPTSIAELDWVGLMEESKSLKPNVAGPDLRFDGRGVVATGAGQGLGIA